MTKRKPEGRTCSICHEVIAGDLTEFNRHRNENHRAEVVAWAQKAAHASHVKAGVRAAEKAARKREKEQARQKAAKTETVIGDAPVDIVDSPREAIRQRDAPAADKPASKVLRAETVDEAQVIYVMPKAFTMDSRLVWQGRVAAVREFGWPQDITPGDFVDTVIYNFFLDRNIELGGYKILKKGDRGNGSQEGACAGAD